MALMCGRWPFPCSQFKKRRDLFIFSEKREKAFFAFFHKKPTHRPRFNQPRKHAPLHVHDHPMSIVPPRRAIYGRADTPHGAWGWGWPEPSNEPPAPKGGKNARRSRRRPRRTNTRPNAAEGVMGRLRGLCGFRPAHYAAEGFPNCPFFRGFKVLSPTLSPTFTA